MNDEAYFDVFSQCQRKKSSKFDFRRRVRIKEKLLQHLQAGVNAMKRFLFFITNDATKIECVCVCLPRKLNPTSVIFLE
jgi:hypothetical protein